MLARKLASNLTVISFCNSQVKLSYRKNNFRRWITKRTRREAVDLTAVERRFTKRFLSQLHQFGLRPLTSKGFPFPRPLLLAKSDGLTGETLFFRALSLRGGNSRHE